MWRGSLLPLGCAAPTRTGTASRSSGSKLPRHKKQAGCSTQAQLLRIFSTIAVVELFSTSPNTFTVPP
ncbi:hypothetical protein B1219_03165 [Pseudomonas ogarae]|nr:hypothetical protein B1219_03165 [Pseudomonas ogarae]OPG79119.1 hypothetical protein B1218_12060 [Pseudomonas ogarae]